MTGGCWMAHPASNIAATTGNRNRIVIPLAF
jgi:hypothetical protein